MSASPRPILLTAGGTGGHVFPAEALAAELAGRGRTLAFVTDRRGQAYGGALGRVDIHRISAGGIAGRGPLARLASIAALGLGFLQARALIRRLSPAAIVGFGGYASVPAMAAGAWTGVPTLMHEQNAVLGRANRMLAGRADLIATSFADVSHVAPGNRDKIVHVGMPVRPAVAARREGETPLLSADGPIRIVVLGGSQGARILSEVIPAALTALPEALRRRLHLAQQCRPEDLDMVRRAYEGSGIEATLASFFDDIPDRLGSAHLVIARSGASTVAELTTLGRPSILVPYAFAVDDHQTANARALERAGAAWLIPQPAFDADTLGRRLLSLFSDPAQLARAAANARAAGIPDAARRLADLVDHLTGATSEVVP
ncbi:MAG: undecaprenyldiphospho-muramoylpentapeptide beta-N-acetylglucosaminyltransferase [Telmatospirillum sp.]|nr:undecaprenyldiphospho-muramoylpentapeptide beta-N-acetylglucosaminyltransferase [Telmatospirillum sp.]